MRRERAGARGWSRWPPKALADRERVSWRSCRPEGFVSPSALDQAQLSVRVQAKALEAARFARDGAAHDVAQARAALMRAQEGAAIKRPGVPRCRWFRRVDGRGGARAAVESEVPVAALGSAAASKWAIRASLEVE
ncbi:MAG: hypothetical protein U5L03_17660 [Burkholderiaceae bacterium]|nr:hypothetical protein [Burkholderiaceae bacterium]